jgi:hypothetical protein
MKSKLAVSTLVAASLFGATAIASAQTEPARPAAGAGVESHTGAGSPPARSATKSSHVKPGMTTGMGSGGAGSGSYGAGKARPGGESVARKPAD